DGIQQFNELDLAFLIALLRHLPQIGQPSADLLPVHVQGVFQPEVNLPRALELRLRFGRDRLLPVRRLKCFGVGPGDLSLAAVEQQRWHRNSHEQGSGGVARRSMGVPPAHFQLDRKSTRLNSSHVKISYAVFCLKKKKYKNK